MNPPKDNIHKVLSNNQHFHWNRILRSTLSYGIALGIFATCPMVRIAATEGSLEPNPAVPPNLYLENLYPTWKQAFTIDELLYQEKTAHQDLIIFRNNHFGTVLALDGVIQVTEKDEAVYHEMMTHVPLIAHGNPKNVLIIGGGDGGILREVLKHKTVEKAVLVEIDESVVAFSKKHLPNISNGAFNDPRAEVIIDDGCKFVKERCNKTDQKFDVIICDSTDPIGPGAVLFTKEFYQDCHAILNRGGIFVNQNGVPFMQPEEIALTYKNRSPHFQSTKFYLGVIPSYVGGFMAFGWASDDDSYTSLSLEELRKRWSALEEKTYYYTPEIHQAAFMLPAFIDKLVQRASQEMKE